MNRKLPLMLGAVLVVAFADTSVLMAAPPAERTMKITNKLILLPIGRGSHGMVSITVDGILVHKASGSIASDKGAIEWWGYLDMSEYVGRTAKISFAGKNISEQSLRLLEFSDTIRHILPIYKEKTRPQFHFSQMQGWNNDPNGMLYHDGKYHFYWQCNPLGKGWGNMYWGHATSPDLVYWTEHKRALRTWGRGVPLDKRHPTMSIAQSFSGGGNVDHTNAAGWQRGDTKTMFVTYTDTGCGESIAYSNDGGKNLIYWEGNPIIRHGGRDPKPFWYAPGRHWCIVVFDQTKEYGKSAAFYKSTDLKKWERCSIVRDLYECPEFIELPVDGDENRKKWVLFGANTECWIGDFDGKTFTPDNPSKDYDPKTVPQTKEGRKKHFKGTMPGKIHLKNERSLFGNIYAGQCYSNHPEGKVIYVAWARVGIRGKNIPFNQGFTLPIELTLKTTKAHGIRMFSSPDKAIDKLHDGTEVALANKRLDAGNRRIVTPVEGQLYDVQMTLIKKGNPNFVTVKFGKSSFRYDFNSQKLDEMPAPLKDGKVNIRFFVDTPFYEVFAADGYSYKLRGRNDQGEPLKNITIEVGPGGGSVVIEKFHAYKMKSIWR